MRLKAGLVWVITLLCFIQAIKAAIVEGLVIDKATSKPIAGATIRMAAFQGRVAISDKDGYYRFSYLSGGKIVLIFSAANYTTQTVSLTLSEKQTTRLDIALEIKRVALKEVTISARINSRSGVQSLLTERNRTQTMDIVSGDQIEHSGSVSAGDAVQHIPGFSVTYSNTGNTDKAIIRGMEARYSYTLINGFKIPSPDDKSRYISLDIFPANLLQSIQVYKSLTADMEGDAIGGATNLVTREPPDSSLLHLELNTGYSNRYFESNYRTFNSHVVQNNSPYDRYGPGYYATGTDFTKANLSFYNQKPLPDQNAVIIAGKRFLRNKLSVIAAADYKNQKTGSDGFFIPLNAQPNPNNVPAFSDYRKQTYSNNKIALSINTSTTYRPDSLNKFTLAYLYLHQTDVENRNTVDTSLTLGRSGVGTGRIYVTDRSRIHQQTLSNLNVKGNHQYHNLGLDWAGIYSIADGSYPDWAELTSNTGSLLSPDGTIKQAPLLLAPLTRAWLRSHEKDADAYLDLHFKAKMSGYLITLGAGGTLRYKTRDNFYNSYLFSPQINEPFTNIYDAVWVNNNGPQNPLGNVNNSNTYTATEKIDAAYLMATLANGESAFTAGVRFEQTNQHFVSALDPGVSYGKTVSIAYKDWLPDLHWKFALRGKQQLKASYYKAISRPALHDITFATIAYEDYNVAGNPFLLRTKADNFDLNYNWYKPNKTFKTGIFYKHIVDAYERTLINGNDELYPIPQGGLTYTPAGTLTEQLKNTGTATNYGLETACSFIWRRFTIAGSYTYTSSAITRMKKMIIRTDPTDPSSNLSTITKPEKGPLAGQSAHMANINLLYKDIYHNWLANISILYTGKRIDLVSPWYGLDYWQRDFVSLNLSAEKKLGKHFKLSAQARNFLNCGLTDDIMTPNPNAAGNNDLPGQLQHNKITVLKEDFYAYFMIGLHYQM